MALATKCPHCNTIFRVAADQLKLRGGIVRCGACQQVFDGNAALVEPAAKPTPVIPEVPVEAKPAAPAAPAVSEYVHGAPVDFELDVAAGEEAASEPSSFSQDDETSPDDTSMPDDETGVTASGDAEAQASADDDASPAAEPGDGDGGPDEPAPSGLVDADDRIEPSLDTPQEHVVAAALDDAHHFEDLPSDEHSAPDAPIADDAGEPSLADAPWPPMEAADTTPPPADEPWSLDEPERDETALHAVAAVNTDAPDDGESVPDDDAPPEQAVVSRRERALKRAQARRDASGPAPDSDAVSEASAVPAGEGSEADDADQAAARMRALAGVEQTAEEDLDHSDLSFVKRVERSQKYGKAITLTMLIGIPLLLAGLVLQGATTFRDTLAANYPQLKPTLAAICAPLGCKITLPAQLNALSIEPGELASMAENTFSFSTVLRNQSKTPQAWPHIELALNDNADKPVLRRVFAPREYLASPADVGKGFGPRSEQSIKLYFQLTELKASGYHISIFYP
jgi:predicted Zn finger-like uncharacterized protein